MKILLPIIITSAISTISCASAPGEPKETHECMDYRSMMTAPMPQSAVDNLRKECEESRQQRAQRD